METSIPLSRPDISEEDIAAVNDVLRSNTLSLGPTGPLFEQEIAAFCGRKYAVAVNSGTSALHLGIRALGIKKGDEIITTPFSFVASVNCFVYEGAVPRFVDILESTYCIDPEAVERAITPKTKAILAVDVFGYMADWPALEAIAKKHNLLLIEDSCEALGSTMNGKHAGAFGEFGAFAFYPNKQMTTGEGGVLVTDRKDIADLAKSMRNQGRSITSSWLSHERLGYNFRLSDMQSALGRSQLKRLPAFIEARRRRAEWYNRDLESLGKDVITPSVQEGVSVSWFVYVVRLAHKFTAKDRDAILRFLREKGIGCNNYFPCLHLQPVYADLGYTLGSFPVSESVSDRTISLPFHNTLTEKEISRVCGTLADAIHSLSVP